MNHLFEDFYIQIAETRRSYDAAELAGDRAGMDAARAQHKALTAALNGQGKSFGLVYHLFEQARERGNKRLDLNDCLWDSEIADIISAFRANGVEEFTFSSRWSDAVETAWLFLRNGCRLEGLIEINGTSKDFSTGEYEKVHGYLFSLT